MRAQKIIENLERDKKMPTLSLRSYFGQISSNFYLKRNRYN